MTEDEEGRYKNSERQFYRSNRQRMDAYSIRQQRPFNVMTASWGCVGWLWNKPVAVIFVRPERFTHDFIEDNAVVTLSFLGKDPDMRSIYNLCGSKSGRECDKIKETGLMPVDTECGSVTFKQARLTLECEKLYKDNIKPECFLNPEISKWYGGSHGGYHDAYILEIKMYM